MFRSVSRRLALSSIRRVAIARGATTVASSIVLSQAARTFWNPFKSDAHAKAITKLAEKHMAENDELVDASLAILKASNSADKFTDAERDALTEVVSVVLTDTRKPGVQFDAVYTALSLPCVLDNPANRELQSELIVVLRSIVPYDVYEIFTECGDAIYRVPVVEEYDLESCPPQHVTNHPQLAVRRLVYVLLGDLSLLDQDLDELNLETLFYQIQGQCTLLGTSKAFGKLKENPSEAILRARLFSVIAELCAEMDKEKSGFVSLDELRTSIVTVAGEGEADRLLQGAKADAQGKIRYHQLSAILTRPKATPA